MSRTLTLRKIPGRPGQVYHPLELSTKPIPKPGPGQLLVKLHAAALNHRDFFQRQSLYPGSSFASPILADGYGTVVALGSDVCSSSQKLLNKPVLLTPCRGWKDDPDGPEEIRKFSVIGGAALYPDGTAQDYIVVPESEVEAAPSHLSPAEGAALPLVGLTGWRALVTKSGNARPGRNILVTGIGGGVALQVLQFGVAKGCNMYVTSGGREKIDKAVSMGAKGGVSYKSEDWENELLGQLPKDRPFLDAVIDGAGGNIVSKAIRILKPGGVISCYGMTTSPKMDWLMQAVMKNVELRGSTMGSRAEFKDMVDFVREQKIKPIVSRTVRGLDNLGEIDGLFEDMKDGKQFGKLVIEISEPVAGNVAANL
jgi:NADPH:quinone reductase-like Zn-dependent oxidoreductase